MTGSQRRLLRPLWIVSLAVFVAHCATVPTGPFGCEGVQIRSDELTIAEAGAYCRYAVGERNKVEGFWGATWTEPIRIHVSSTYRISRAFVPGHHGNRGFVNDRRLKATACRWQDDAPTFRRWFVPT
ncbi:MAG: hypothetical protein ACREOH_14480, partial [Candidatus Entotheonellia bacterium]